MPHFTLDTLHYYLLMDFAFQDTTYSRPYCVNKSIMDGYKIIREVML